MGGGPTATLIAVAWFCFQTCATLASGAESRWRLSLKAGWNDPSLSLDTVEAAGGGVRASSSAGLGAGISIERALTHRLGIELGVFHAGDEIDVTDVSSSGRIDRASDDLAFRTLSLALHFHPRPDARMDFFLGPVLSWVDYQGLSFDFGDGSAVVRARIAGDWAWGAVVGMNVPFANRRFLEPKNPVWPWGSNRFLS